MTRNLLLFLLLACTAATAETGFRTAVKLVESRYAVRHHGVPGLWLAKPFMIGSGVGGLKIAEFGSFHIPSEDSHALKQQLSRSLGSEWHPFIEEWSKRDGEWSLIYMKTDAEKVRMLIMTSDSDEGLTVVEMKLSPKALDRWVDDPVDSAKHKNAIESKGSAVPKQGAEDHTVADQTDTQIATTHAAR
jgi:hypothetical protein